jgi:hypothetical protein
VMVVPCPERAEEILLAGDMPCPRCRGVLRPFGTGRIRTVRDVGADTVTVTPRRARCADCQVTPTLGHGLNLLAGAAVRLRDSFDISDPVWSLIGFFAHGRLLAPPRTLRR